MRSIGVAKEISRKFLKSPLPLNLKITNYGYNFGQIFNNRDYLHIHKSSKTETLNSIV